MFIFWPSRTRLLREQQRTDNRKSQDCGNHGKGDPDRDLVEVDGQHLDADEDEDNRQADPEEMESIHDAVQQEVRRAQP